MDHLLDAVDRAVEQSNWYAALMLSLTLPDICAKVDGRSGKRYISWAKDWIEPMFAAEVARPMPEEFVKRLLQLQGDPSTTDKDREDFRLDHRAYRKSAGPYIQQFLHAEDLYALRCAFCHGGSYELSTGTVRKVLRRFHMTTPDGGSHMNLITSGAETALQLRVDLFCDQISTAVKLWLEARSGDPEVAQRLEMLARLQSSEVLINNLY